MNLDEAQTFVEMNSKLVSDTNKYSRCIDGRYENTGDLAMIAKRLSKMPYEQQFMIHRLSNYPSL